MTRMGGNFSPSTTDVKRHFQNGVVKLCQPGISCPAKLSFRLLIDHVFA
jgi:hypothetical protein